MRIVYGVHQTPFGECLLAVTERGVCALEFVPPGGRRAAASRLEANWKTADVRRDTARTGPVIDQILAALGGQPSEFRLLLKGTNFQIKVWQALLRIPPGSLACYEDVASAVCEPAASRAVGCAVAANPVALLIPCHRVIRKVGVVGGYRWGTARKQAIIGWEAAQQHRCTAPVG